MSSSVSLEFSPAAIFSSFLFVGTPAVTTTQPGFFCLSVHRPFFGYCTRWAPAAMISNIFFFFFVVNYNWVDWNVSWDFSTWRISPNPGVKFLFVFKSHHCCPQTTSFMSSLCWTNRKETNCHIDLFNLFSFKKAPPWEPSSIQLEAVNSMVFAYGAPYIWFFVCKRGAMAAVFLFGGRDWLFKSIFEPKKAA